MPGRTIIIIKLLWLYGDHIFVLFSIQVHEVVDVNWKVISRFERQDHKIWYEVRVNDFTLELLKANIHYVLAKMPLEICIKVDRKLSPKNWLLQPIQRRSFKWHGISFTMFEAWCKHYNEIKSFMQGFFLTYDFVNEEGLTLPKKIYSLSRL